MPGARRRPGRAAAPGRVRHRTVGEADGAGKYDEPGALYAEKRREDWLRDTHRMEVVRWGAADIRTRAARTALVAHFHRAFARRS